MSRLLKSLNFVYVTKFQFVKIEFFQRNIFSVTNIFPGERSVIQNGMSGQTQSRKVGVGDG